MGYKRLFVASLLTIVAVFLLMSRQWHKSINVSFQADGNNEVVFQVYYTTKHSKSFDEQKSVKQAVDLKKRKQVSLDIPIKKIQQLRLDFGSRPGKLEIFDLYVNGKPVKFSKNIDAQFRFYQIDDYRLSENRLLIDSDKDDPSIVFRQLYNIKAQRTVNVELLIIVSVVSFLLFYKLVNYLAKFKIQEHHSRIDIVFLCCFFAVLFVPMMKINSLQKSEQENRLLAVYKPLFLSQGFNYKFGEQFNSWFSDRFFGREDIIKYYSFLKFKLNRYYSNSSAMIGRNGWMFRLDDVHEVEYLSQADFDVISDNISYLQQFCEKKKIKCYVEIVPRKVLFATDNMIIKSDFGAEKLISLNNYLLQKNGFQFIYPFDEMMEAHKQDMVYFKTDHHWTEWGAYIGYQAFIKKVQKDFPDVMAVKEDDFNIFYSKQVRAEYDRLFWKGYMCQMLNLDDKDCSLDVDYKYFVHKNEAHLKISKLPDMQKEFYYPDGTDRKIIVIGNSFSENFSSFIPYTFKYAKKIRSNIPQDNSLNLSRWEKDITEFKPDIMVIVFHAEYISKLKTIKG